MKHLALLLAAGLIASPAIAVEGDAAAPAPAAASSHDAAPAHGAPAHKPAKKKDVGAAAEKADGKDKMKDKDKTADHKPVLSKSAYVKLLAAELKRHTPKSADNQTGSIHVSFTVGASGRIVSHKVRSVTNPALEPVVGQILASVHTPPPPGGAFSAVQEFNFH